MGSHYLGTRGIVLSSMHSIEQEKVTTKVGLKCA